MISTTRAVTPAALRCSCLTAKHATCLPLKSPRGCVEAVGPVPEAQKVSFGRVSMFGKPVSVSLLGNNLAELKRARDLLIAELKKFSSLKDVVDSEQEGRREIDITLKPRAYALGLTVRDVVGQVRQGFFGYEAQRIQRGRDEIRVWVRYPEQDRASLGLLDQMRIRTPQGEYPFSELATYEVKRGISQINHLNRRREITVEASLAEEKQDLPPLLDEIREEVIPRVLSQVHGVQVSYEGQAREQNKATASILRAFPLALVGMFIMIVLVFRSVMQAAPCFFTDTAGTGRRDLGPRHSGYSAQYALDLRDNRPDRYYRQ